MRYKLAILTLVLMSTVYYSNAQESNNIIEYQVTPDVVYGQGKVVNNENEEMMDLKMDVYEPINPSDEPHPAVILIHGGSFHRGNPRETYLESGAQTTSMQDYARRFAAEGFVCFTIRYRLAGDNPIPSYEEYSDEDLDPKSWTDPAGLQQVNLIRQRADLDALTAEDAHILKNAILAAAEDLRTAIQFVKNAEAQFNIDNTRIGIGGFSAGAVTSISVAYGLKEEVAAVFTNSGFPSGFNIYKSLTKSSIKPKLLLFMGQNDIPAVTQALPSFLRHLEATGVEHEFCWVPGFGHFYPGGAISLSNDGRKESVEERILVFLNNALKRSK